MERQLKFSVLEDNYGGLLSLEDVHFFYYDVCFDHEMGYSLSYKWDKDIESFLKDNGILIEVVPVEQIPSSFEKNKMYLTMSEIDRENKAAAFYRHLRNSFSHYEIGRSDDFFNMKDLIFDTKGKTTKTTMIGKIEIRLFKELFTYFFNQKVVMEDNYNRYLYPEF